MRKKQVIAENIDLKCQINQLKSELETLNKQLQELSAEREKYKNLYEDCEAKLNAQLAEVSSLSEKIKELESELTTSQQLISEMENQKQVVDSSIVDNSAEMEAARKELEQNEQLIQQLGAEKEILSVNIERLEAQIQKEKRLNLALKAEIEDLKKAQQPLVSDTITQNAVDKSATVLKTPEYIEYPSPNIKQPAQVSDQAMQAGAKIIGNVVVQAALLSSRIASSKDPNARELLTLALGKTEMFKADILQQVHSDISLEQKIENMNLLADETLEYFKSLEGQLEAK